MTPDPSTPTGTPGTMAATSLGVDPTSAIVTVPATVPGPDRCPRTIGNLPQWVPPWRVGSARPSWTCSTTQT